MSKTTQRNKKAAAKQPKLEKNESPAEVKADLTAVCCHCRSRKDKQCSCKESPNFGKYIAKKLEACKCFKQKG